MLTADQIIDLRAALATIRTMPAGRMHPPAVKHLRSKLVEMGLLEARPVRYEGTSYFLTDAGRVALG